MPPPNFGKREWAREAAKHNKKLVVKNMGYAVRTVFRAAPGFVISKTLGSLLYWFFTSYVQQILFLKRILELVTAGGEFRQYMKELLLFCAAGLISLGVSSFCDAVSGTGQKRVYKVLSNMIYKKACEVDIEAYENPEYFDNYKRATEVVTDDYYSRIVNGISGLVARVVSGIFLISYVATVDPKLLLILLSIIIIFVLNNVRAGIIFEKNKQMTPNNRKKAYVKRVVFLRDFAKDIRTSGIFGVMKRLNERAAQDNMDIIVRYGKKLALISLAAGTVGNALPVVLTYAYSAYRLVVKKNLAIADFSVVMTSINNVKQMINEVSWQLRMMQDAAMYFQCLREFMNYGSNVENGSRPAGRIESIEFRNVTFTYPGSKSPVLKNVSLKINGGETVAVVGRNGAGKTTFVKLLLRFYDPDEGEILYNGVNVKEYDIGSLRERIGTVFQDYKVFALSVNENVLCREAENDADRAAARAAMEQSGAWDRISRLPGKDESLLTREFDNEGVGLSGGEQQKIAAARMFAHAFDLAVLDEPSSALDPIAEYRMYEALIDATANKTVIYISHRLASAALSDRVFMFEHGELTESGTHEELLELGGGYADMFRKQAENYS